MELNLIGLFLFIKMISVFVFLTFFAGVLGSNEPLLGDDPKISRYGGGEKHERKPDPGASELDTGTDEVYRTVEEALVACVHKCMMDDWELRGKINKSSGMDFTKIITLKTIYPHTRFRSCFWRCPVSAKKILIRTFFSNTKNNYVSVSVLKLIFSPKCRNSIMTNRKRNLVSPYRILNRILKIMGNYSRNPTE